MPQFITPEELFEPSPCEHDTTNPEVFQDEGDRVHRASWALASVCKKCQSIFVYGSGYGYWEDYVK